MGFSSLAEVFGDVLGEGGAASAAGTAGAAGGSSLGSSLAYGAAAAGATAIGGKLLAPKAVVPPSPVIPANEVNSDVQDVNNRQMQRQAIAGGIQSTFGTPGGAEGSMLNPSNMSNKTLLGA